MKAKLAIEEDDAAFARFGRASLIPGIQKSIQYLEQMLFDLRVGIAAAEAGAVPQTAAPSKGSASYWARMTDEEKSAEMKRRMAKGKRKKNKANDKHPRNPAHPEHQAWIDKIARVKAAKKRARLKRVA